MSLKNTAARKASFIFSFKTQFLKYGQADAIFKMRRQKQCAPNYYSLPTIVFPDHLKIKT